mmetsp:Transcript_119858/g.208062  ORF Transcript_119858/g.208062 Transcript_119858/m.208062 type:complete len:504 (-) Transcript_119858:277-1788(-)
MNLIFLTIGALCCLLTWRRPTTAMRPSDKEDSYEMTLGANGRGIPMSKSAERSNANSSSSPDEVQSNSSSPPDEVQSIGLLKLQATSDRRSHRQLLNSRVYQEGMSPPSLLQIQRRFYNPLVGILVTPQKVEYLVHGNPREWRCDGDKEPKGLKNEKCSMNLNFMLLNCPDYICTKTKTSFNGKTSIVNKENQFVGEKASQTMFGHWRVAIPFFESAKKYKQVPSSLNKKNGKEWLKFTSIPWSKTVMNFDSDGAEVVYQYNVQKSSHGWWTPTAGSTHAFRLNDPPPADVAEQVYVGVCIENAGWDVKSKDSENYKRLSHNQAILNAEMDFRNWKDLGDNKFSGALVYRLLDAPFSLMLTQFQYMSSKATAKLQCEPDSEDPDAYRCHSKKIACGEFSNNCPWTTPFHANIQFSRNVIRVNATDPNTNHSTIYALWPVWKRMNTLKKIAKDNMKQYSVPANEIPQDMRTPPPIGSPQRERKRRTTKKRKKKNKKTKVARVDP